jgi:hypothetical protein
MLKFTKTVPGTIQRSITMKKQILLTALTLTLLASAVMTAAAEEAVATILFEPKHGPYGWTYSLSTDPDSKIADKSMWMDYNNVGRAIDTLPNYLEKGAKIVYENEGMRNQMGEMVAPSRMIAIILEDGTYIELTKLVSIREIAWYFDYLFQKLVREGRAR